MWKIFIMFYLWIYLYSNRCAMVIHLVFHKQHGQIHLNVHLLFRISWKNYMCPPMLSYKAQICLCRHFTQRVARYRHNNQASGKEISRVKNWWPDLWGKVIKKNVGYRIFSINTNLLLWGKGRYFFHKLTDPLFLIFGKLYFSDTVKENRIFAIKLCIHITNYHILHHHRYP